MMQVLRKYRTCTWRRFVFWRGGALGGVRTGACSELGSISERGFVGRLSLPLNHSKVKPRRSDDQTPKHRNTTSTPNMPGTLSIRKSIRWIPGPEQAHEPTSTMVLTSPEGRYVDVRVLKGEGGTIERGGWEMLDGIKREGGRKRGKK